MNRQQSLGGGARGFIPLKGRNIGVETPTYRGITSEEVGWTFSSTAPKIAFTLAEVLITLGIIGVVAAMTLPGLIANYKKHEIAVRLKASYSILSQMLTRAQADYGDPVHWDFNSVYGSQGGMENSLKRIESLVQKYFIPYLTNIQDHRIATLAEAGYPVYHLADGSVDAHNLNDLNKRHYVIEFSNGTTVFVYVDSAVGFGTTNIILYIDVNGKKNPNVFGKDTFFAKINSKTGRLEFYGAGVGKDDLIESCKTRNIVCGALIMHDGWEITRDYPINIR